MQNRFSMFLVMLVVVLLLVVVGVRGMQLREHPYSCVHLTSGWGSSSDLWNFLCAILFKVRLSYGSYPHLPLEGESVSHSVMSDIP